MSAIIFKFSRKSFLDTFLAHAFQRAKRLAGEAGLAGPDFSHIICSEQAAPHLGAGLGCFHGPDAHKMRCFLPVDTDQHKHMNEKGPSRPHDQSWCHSSSATAIGKRVHIA
jgi:hypothetical protein